MRPFYFERKYTVIPVPSTAFRAGSGRYFAVFYERIQIFQSLCSFGMGILLATVFRKIL